MVVHKQVIRHIYPVYHHILVGNISNVLDLLRKMLEMGYKVIDIDGFNCNEIQDMIDHACTMEGLSHACTHIRVRHMPSLAIHIQQEESIHLLLRVR